MFIVKKYNTGSAATFFYAVATSFMVCTLPGYAQVVPPINMLDPSYKPKHDSITLSTSADIGIQNFTWFKIPPQGFWARTFFTYSVTIKNLSSKKIVAYDGVFFRYGVYNEQLSCLPFEHSYTASELDAGKSETVDVADAPEVFTVVPVVRRIRFEDGSVWIANGADIVTGIKNARPALPPPSTYIRQPDLDDEADILGTVTNLIDELTEVLVW